MAEIETTELEHAQATATYNVDDYDWRVTAADRVMRLLREFDLDAVVDCLRETASEAIAMDQKESLEAADNMAFLASMLAKPEFKKLLKKEGRLLEQLSQLHEDWCVTRASVRARQAELKSLHDQFMQLIDWSRGNSEKARVLREFLAAEWDARGTEITDYGFELLGAVLQDIQITAEQAPGKRYFWAAYQVKPGKYLALGDVAARLPEVRKSLPQLRKLMKLRREQELEMSRMGWDRIDATKYCGEYLKSYQETIYSVDLAMLARRLGRNAALLPS